MIPRYTINLLSSLSRWLDTRADTIWAKSFGHRDLMKNYAKSLNEIVAYFKEQYEGQTCTRCNGTPGPLLRPVDAMDCECVPRQHVLYADTILPMNLSLDHAHNEVSIVWQKPGIGHPDLQMTCVEVRTGPHFKTVTFDGDVKDLVLAPDTLNTLVFGRTRDGYYTLIKLFQTSNK